MGTVIGFMTRELAMRDLRDASPWGAADLEVVAATAARIPAGDPDAWLREWTAAGGAARARAGERGDAAHYLYAASYYAAALVVIADSDGSVDEGQLWNRQRDCWDHAAAALGGERLSVAYEDTGLPGYFFSGGPGRRPLIVVDPGGRATTSQAWARAGAAAHARGYHWMTFDGPGRQAALHRQGLVLRPDWEAVLSPVADAMIARADVDPFRIAVLGCELGGFGVTRALAFEHRFAAAIAAPGVLDAAAPWLDSLPAAARTALCDHDREAFDSELHLADLFAPQTSARLRRGVLSFDDSGASLYDVYQRIRSFRLGAEPDLIATPLLVCGGSEDRLWPGQSAMLHERLGGRSDLLSDRHDPGAILAWIEGLV
jgi:hypothetical protein